MFYKKGTWGTIVVVVAGAILLLIVLLGPSKLSIKEILGIKELTGMSPEATVKGADEAFSNKYYDEAIRLYNEALQLYANEGETRFLKNKDAAQAQYQIGNCYYAMDKEAYDVSGDHDLGLINRALTEYKKVLDFSIGGDFKNKVDDIIQEVTGIQEMEQRKLLGGY
jgi:tetratricopeptide (TPR) repeat protein